MATTLDLLQDVVPSHIPGYYPSAQEWTFKDSFLFALENMPLIGGIINSLEGTGNTATVKAANLYVQKTGLPDPDIDTLVSWVKNFIIVAAVLLAILLVVVGIVYLYKLVKEFK